MFYKPFSRLASQGFTKALVHGYAPSVVAASQSSYVSTTTSFSQFHSLPAHKLSRASQLQNTFQGASGSSGAGAKAGHASQGANTNSNADGGLALYYAAWQHAQQTGDDTDWKQHQFARRIGWKSPEKTADARTRHRRDSLSEEEVLRPSLAPGDRPYSESAAHDIKKAQDASEEAEALARVDEAIAREIQSVNESKALEAESMKDGASTSRSTDAVATAQLQELDGPIFGETESPVSAPNSLLDSSVTSIGSPAIHESIALSNRIVELSESQQFAEIPPVFEYMLEQGLVPTVSAYNAIILSAVHLEMNTHHVLPKALEVYGEMSRRLVTPNETTFRILLQFLTTRTTTAAEVMAGLEQRKARFSTTGGLFVFHSSELEYELFEDDTSIDYATKLYKIAMSTIPNITFPSNVYHSLIQACAKQHRVDDMAVVFSDMKSRQVSVEGPLFIPMIHAFAAAKDLNSANQCYQEYKDLAIGRANNNSGAGDQQDMEVYAALIKAYISCGHEESGLRFYDRVMESYTNASNGATRARAMQAAFTLEASLQYLVETGNFAAGLKIVNDAGLDQGLRDRAMGKLCSSAADANEMVTAKMAYSSMTPEYEDITPTMAMMALSIRQGDLASAEVFWERIHASESVAPNLTDLTTMYAVALMRTGSIEDGLMKARSMFARIRGSTTSAYGRSNIMEDVDEAIIVFGETLIKANAILSASASIALVRMMIENGGLVSPVAEHAIASLGPECVFQLGFQDIALALHVQAGMLVERSDASDPAYVARFSHLLETVLNRGIAMDPSTVNMVIEALPKLHGRRPDLLHKWGDFQQPLTRLDQAPTVYTPITPASPGAETPTQNDGYDPYAYNTDYRASTVIGEQLESTTGKIENHLSDALGRFRNVRRAGRHPRYHTYAKLITAAGRTNQVHLIREILGMARTDVPFLPHYPAVKAGWISILDSVVAAYLTVGDRNLAAQYHQDLLDMGAAPSANTFGLYITTLKESTKTFDDATEAVRIFQRALTEGVEPGVFLYNAVIGKLGKARRIDDCLFYFGDMQSRNIRPSSVTYGTLVNALCRTSEERFAEEMFDEMESMPNYRPRAAPYNCIIQYFLNTKRDRSKVLTYFERMKSRNIKPTSHTYKLLIEAHASLEPVDLPAAQAVFDDIKASGMRPEAVHYGTLIHAKGCVMHDMAGAREVFDSVLAGGAIRPTDNLYQNLLEAMVANHHVQQTPEILKDMSSRNVGMTPYIANTLIHGWAAEGDIVKAKSIYDSLGDEKREPSTYEAMARAFLAAEDHHSASAVAQEMLRKGYPSAVAEKVLVLVDGAVS